MLGGCPWTLWLPRCCFVMSQFHAPNTDAACWTENNASAERPLRRLPWRRDVYGHVRSNFNPRLPSPWECNTYEPPLCASFVRLCSTITLRSMHGQTCNINYNFQCFVIAIAIITVAIVSWCGAAWEEDLPSGHSMANLSGNAMVRSGGKWIPLTLNASSNGVLQWKAYHP
eukprot:3355407-Amphidinium_carterae.1